MRSAHGNSFNHLVRAGEQCRGHVETDPAVRERVYQLAPEVEQNHDTARKGAALIIDVSSLGGSTVRGMVRVAPSQ